MKRLFINRNIELDMIEEKVYNGEKNRRGIIFMETKQHLAHITTINGKRKDQTIAAHSIAVAEYAGQALESVDMYHVGYLTGLIHDADPSTLVSDNGKAPTSHFFRQAYRLSLCNRRFHQKAAYIADP